MDDATVASLLHAWEPVYGKPAAWEPLREERDVFAVTIAGAGFVLKNEWLTSFAAILVGYTMVSPLSARERNAVWPVMLATQLLFVEVFTAMDNAPATALNLNAFHWIYDHRGGIEGRLRDATPPSS